MPWCKHGGRKTMIAPDVLAMPARVDVTLVKALARAFRWRRLLEDGSYGIIREVAAAEKINASYLCRVLRLTLPAPDIVEAIFGWATAGGHDVAAADAGGGGGVGGSATLRSRCRANGLACREECGGRRHHSVDRTSLHQPLVA